jgi:hypothetical protein
MMIKVRLPILSIAFSELKRLSHKAPICQCQRNQAFPEFPSLQKCSMQKGEQSPTDFYEQPSVQQAQLHRNKPDCSRVDEYTSEDESSANGIDGHRQ